MWAWLARTPVWLAAAVCLFFAASLRDTRGVPLGYDVAQSAPLAPPIDPDASASLSVTVLDPSGQPVPDASVTIYTITGGSAVRTGQALTDAQGKAALVGLPPGEAWLIVRGDERARASSRLVLEVGPARERVVTLGPARHFEVVVVDTAERPIPSVTVELFGADPLSYRKTTDAQGLAAFDGLGAEPWAVEVNAAGYDGKLFPSLEGADSPFFVKLERLGSLEVVVLGPDGHPVAGAKVLAAGSALWPARSAESDATGTVRIAGLPRGFYELRAEHGDLVSGADGGIMLDRGEQKRIELRLEPGLFVTVHVVDPAVDDKKAGIGAADVALVNGGLSSFPLYGRTDASGLVTLGPINGEDATVSVRAHGYVARNAVPLEPDKGELEVTLVRGATVTGEVVDDRGFPVDGVSLEAVGTDLDGMPVAESSATTGFRDDHFAFSLPGAVPLIPVGELGVMPIVPDLPLGGSPGAPLVVRANRDGEDPWVSDRYGRFALFPVPPGRVRVVARHPSYAEALSEPLTLAPGGEATVKLVLRRGGVIEGRVLEADRLPVGGARVVLSDADSGIDRITYSADDGSFAFTAVGKNSTVAVSRGREFEETAMHIDLTVEDGARKEIEITLPERREDVALRVTDDRGYPLDRVEVHAASLDPDEALGRTLFTDDSGRAKIAGARGLPLRIVLERPGKAPAVSEIDPTPGEVDLVMAEGIAVEGTVTGRNGYERLDEAAVTLWTPTGVRRTKTDKEGAFAFRDLALGSGRLLLSKSGYASRELAVVVKGEPQRPTDLGRFDLAYAGSIRGVVRDGREQPIAGARVAVGRVPTYLPLGALPPGVAVTDAKGRFTLADIAPGLVVVEAYVAGVGRSALGNVEVRASEVTSDIVVVLGDDADPAPALDLKGTGSLAVTLREQGRGAQAQVHVEHVPLGGEAERAGIEPGDVLLAVNGVPVRSIEEARRRMKGPAGEEFVAQLARGADLRWRVRVKRERIRE